MKALQDGNETISKGLKLDSVFNSLKHFQVCQPGLPPCIGHDLFERIVAYEVAYDLAIYIMYFVKVNTFFTHSELNRSIRQFSYQGSHANSTPSEVGEKGIQLGGQATENWSLLRLFPVIIGKKTADTEDWVWQLKILLKELVE